MLIKFLSGSIVLISVLFFSIAGAKDITVQTDIGPLEATSTTPKGKFKQKVRALTKKERIHLAKLNAEAVKILSRYAKSSKRKTISPENLDFAYGAWLKDINYKKATANTVIQSFGAALGLYLAKRANTKWKIVTDQYGTDLALIFIKTGMQTYPIASVAKRVNRNEEPFFVLLYNFMKVMGNKEKKEIP